MNRKKEVLFLVVGDFIAINTAWFIYYWARMDSGIFKRGNLVDTTPSAIAETSLIIYGLWMISFLFFGLYRSWYVRPLFDEMITVLKTLTIGSVGLFILLWWDPLSDLEKPAYNDPRLLALAYFFILCFCVVVIRLLIRYSQRRLIEIGFGRRATLIVGEIIRAKELAREISLYPKLGYNIVGFLTPLNGLNGSVSEQSLLISSGKNPSDKHSIPYLGSSTELVKIVERQNIKEVLLALDSKDHDQLMSIIGTLAGSSIGIKILPDLYDIVTGQARTREIYGFPLIDINPELQRPWEEVTKRLLDISISLAILIIGFPLWGLIGLAIKLTSKGPIIFSQERTGKNGHHFSIYKFRSMKTDAEKNGPKRASKNDPRTTSLGRFLRRSHLDEVPQFINVLKGDMSIVGPRPEQPFFVDQLVHQIPFYTRRLKVRPGITGLYQAMVDKYDETVDDVKNRIRYDFMYIESMSFRLDIKILFRTAITMLKGKGQA